MKRKNWKLIETKAYNNLKSLYNLATPDEIFQGKYWYSNANYKAFGIGTANNYSTAKVCGVIAALSPGLKWEKNVPNAEALIKMFSASLEIDSAFGLSVYGKDPIKKAWRILQGEPILDVLSGPKVTNFFKNLSNPSDPSSITIDGHIKLACLGTRLGNHDSGPVSTTVRTSEYPHYAAVVTKLAFELGFLPSKLQAILWITFRRLPIGYKLS